jgi:hypothetical protein
MNALDFIRVYNCVPKNICNNFLKNFKKTKFQYHRWQDKTGKLIGSRKNLKEELKNYWLNQEEINILLPFVAEATSQYRHDVRSIYPFLDLIKTYKEPSQLIYKLSGFRVNKYNKNTNMAVHVDHIYDLFDGKEKGIPVLSIVGLLNDNFKGGEFEICNQKLLLKQGDVLIFPSNFMYPHQVKTITKGIRYSFVSWGY